MPNTVPLLLQTSEVKQKRKSKQSSKIIKIRIVRNRAPANYFQNKLELIADQRFRFLPLATLNRPENLLLQVALFEHVHRHGVRIMHRERFRLARRKSNLRVVFHADKGKIRN